MKHLNFLDLARLAMPLIADARGVGGQPDMAQRVGNLALAIRHPAMGLGGGAVPPLAPRAFVRGVVRERTATGDHIVDAAGMVKNPSTNIQNSAFPVS